MDTIQKNITIREICKQYKILILLIFSILLISCEKLPYYGSSITKDNVCMKISISNPDSCGGCEILIAINNKTNKTIKKIKGETLIKNYYQEPLQDYITGQYYINFQIPGPIKSGVSKFSLIDKFYNSAAYYADITEYKVIFE